MKVQKRDGRNEDVSFDKILNRIKNISIERKSLNIDPSIIAQKVCSELYDGVSTSELDELTSQISISLYSNNLDYGELASRILISNHHKNTEDNYINLINKLYNNKLIAKYLYDIIIQNKDIILERFDYNKDYLFDYFGFKTLEKSYLLKINKKVEERPQHLLMRVALCVHRDNINNALSMYDKLSNKDYIHATPTLFNAGTNREQLYSCFLLKIKDDSVKGIYKTL